MKALLILMALFSSFSLSARTIITADESQNNDYLTCSLKPVYSEQRQKILYTIFKNKEKVYHSQSQLMAIDKMIELKTRNFCKPMSVECFLIETRDSNDFSIIMKNSMFFEAGKTKEEAVSTMKKLQNNKICTANGIQFADFDYN